MIFKKKRSKAEQKQLELCIRVIDEYSTIKLQNKELFSRIKDLEARVERLEPKEVMKMSKGEL